MEGTFIKLDRKILKWEWFDDPYMFKTFVYLLLKANHKDGRWQGVLVKKGQIITGRLKLATALGFSEMKIRTCLNKLKTTNEISIETTSRFSIITICKYELYQDSKKNINQPINQQTTNKQPTNNQQTTTIKECKEYKNEKNEKNESNAPNFLKNSNLFRQPNIPVFENVHRVFVQNGGNEEMAKNFFNTYESLGWFKNGSPITNFSNLIPSYVDNWKKNECRKQSPNGQVVPEKVKKTQDELEEEMNQWLNDN
jgi:hypothetical protein